MRPSATPNPVNGNFEELESDGITPVAWRLEQGDTTTEVPCSVDDTHAASGQNSILCDVTAYPDPDPYPSISTPHNFRSEPQHWNYSGPLTSDVFEVVPGSMYELSFMASWAGNNTLGDLF